MAEPVKLADLNRVQPSSTELKRHEIQSKEEERDYMAPREKNTMTSQW